MVQAGRDAMTSSAGRGLCRMHVTHDRDDPGPESIARRRAAAWRLPRLGIGWRLTLGLAAVGRSFSSRPGARGPHHPGGARGRAQHAERTRAARQQRQRRAREARRLRPRRERIPPGSQRRRTSPASPTPATRSRGAVGSYFDNAPAQVVARRRPELRAQLTSHIDNGRAARQAAPRSARSGSMSARRHWTACYQRIASAGGAGPRHQRHPGGRAPARSPNSSRPSTRCAATSRRHASSRSANATSMRAAGAHTSRNSCARPAPPGSSLVRQDFQEAVQQRVQTERFDAQSAAAVSIPWRGQRRPDGGRAGAAAEAGARRAGATPRSTPPAPPRRREHTLRNTAADGARRCCCWYRYCWW